MVKNASTLIPVTNGVSASEEVNDIESYLVALGGYHHHRALQLDARCAEFWYETTSMRTGSDFTTCMELRGNGWKTAGATAIRERRRTARRGKRASAAVVLRAAALGTAFHGASARRTASRWEPISGTTPPAASAWPGPFDCLDHYILTPGGLGA